MKAEPWSPQTSQWLSCVARSPEITVAASGMELGIRKATIQAVLRKRMNVHAYKIQLRVEIKLLILRKLSNIHI
jgi:hypothetical protein